MSRPCHWAWGQLPRAVHVLHLPWHCPHETPYVANVVTEVISFITAGLYARSKHETFYLKSTASPSEFREDAESTRGWPSGDFAVTAAPPHGVSCLPGLSHPPTRPPPTRAPWSTTRARGPRAEASTHVPTPGWDPGPVTTQGAELHLTRVPVPLPPPRDKWAPARPAPATDSRRAGPPLFCKIINLQNSKLHTVSLCTHSAPVLGGRVCP